MKINNVEINKANFPGNNGAGGHTRNTGIGFNFVTITPTGAVTFREDAEADSEFLGKLGVEFADESALMEFIATEFSVTA